MTKNSSVYDCAIVGGGVAGLCLSILLAKRGFSVILFEKNKYPFHKVCGEYVSNESLGFFLRLGLPLKEWDLPQINTIGISSEKGFMFNASLELGGFGLSRQKLDHELARLASQNAVEVMQQEKVIEIKSGRIITNKGEYEARVCAGAFGKANPVFSATDAGAVTNHNYIGVKYHIKTEFPSNRIELHNFKKGYCGISRIENEKFCLCYLSSASNLKNHGNKIKDMEEGVLKKNPYLRKIFNESEVLDGFPVTVSNIKFEARKTSDENLIYLGDAAGCISPLTGNGISMAAYTSYFLSGIIERYLKNEITSLQLRQEYDDFWRSSFLKRIRHGKRLQFLFGKGNLSDLALRALNPFEKLKSRIVETTHGASF